MSGEPFFLPMLGISRKEYIGLAKETIKFFSLSDFLQLEKEKQKEREKLAEE